MKSMRIFAIFWLSGLIAGVVLMERWRRHGGRYVPVEAVTAIPADVPLTAATPPPTPNIVRLVVTGAKLDAERVRQKVRPTSAPAQEVTR